MQRLRNGNGRETACISTVYIYGRDRRQAPGADARRWQLRVMLATGRLGVPEATPIIISPAALQTISHASVGQSRGPTDPQPSWRSRDPSNRVGRRAHPGSTGTSPASHSRFSATELRCVLVHQIHLHDHKFLMVCAN